VRDSTRHAYILKVETLHDPDLFPISSNDGTRRLVIPPQSSESPTRPPPPKVTILRRPHTKKSSHEDTKWNGKNIVVECYVFGKSQFKISARRATMLTKVYRGFSRSVQANIGKVPKKLDNGHFLQNFRIYHSLITISFNVIVLVTEEWPKIYQIGKL
jgi:hypothetical protein